MQLQLWWSRAAGMREATIATGQTDVSGTRVGFVGLGTMGSAMARCLISAGCDLTIYDIRAEAALELSQAGARLVDSPREAAELSNVVFTSLPGPTEVEYAVLDPAIGILRGLHAGSCYIDTSTSSPFLCETVANACRAREVDVLDAPVSGRPPEMTMMVGGDPQTFVKYQPLLRVVARDVFLVGGIGKGMATKLASQLILWCNFVAAAEGLLLAAKSGVDVGALVTAISKSASSSRVFEHRFPTMVLAGEFKSGPPTGVGPLDIAAKDVALALQLARSVGVPSTFGLVVDDVMKRAQANGWGGEASHGAIRVLEEIVGIELRADAPN